MLGGLRRSLANHGGIVGRRTCVWLFVRVKAPNGCRRPARLKALAANDRQRVLLWSSKRHPLPGFLGKQSRHPSRGQGRGEGKK